MGIDDNNSSEVNLSKEQKEEELDKQVSKKYDEFMKKGNREKNMKLYT